MASKSFNAPTPGVPFFAPQHAVSPGTPFHPDSNVPTLFTPLQIRGVRLRNRILVAPMCQYSTAHAGPDIGALTSYHVATLGHYALKGAALVFIEATGVQFNGRITPNCPGLWSDDQIAGVKAVVDIVHSQRALCGIQLAHAGRKASTVAPWLAGRQKRPSLRATVADGGWPDNVVGPSGGEELTWDGKRSDDPSGGFYAPRELSVDDIRELVDEWKQAAVRSVKAGVDCIEIHAAHGYLFHQFLSPITNRRTDQYGGSFENRTRALLETIQGIRSVIPESMPLFLRVSSTEWMDGTDLGKKLGSWNVDSTIELAKLVSDVGVDLLDVSSGGNHPSQRINMFDSKDYQIRIAAQIRRELKAANKHLFIGAVGLITEATQARDILQTNSMVQAPPTSDQVEAPVGEGEVTVKEEAQAAEQMTDTKGDKEAMADVILVARQFMREPEWVLRVAHLLGVDVAWPSQFLRVRFPKL